MKQSLKLLIGLVAITVFGTSSAAYAHGLVQDTTGKVDSILHYVPDDDPKVGILTLFHYEFEKTFNVTGSTANLEITTNKGAFVASPAAMVGHNTAAASYTFSKAGTYNIALNVVTPKGQLYSFKTTEEITNPSEDKKASQVEILWFLISSAAVLAVGIFALLNLYKKHARS